MYGSNTPTQQIAERFAFSDLIQKNDVSESLKKILQNDASTIKLVPTIIYFRKEISGQANNAEILKATDELVKGIRNLDKARFPQNEAFIGTHWRVGFSTDAAQGKESEVDYNSTMNKGVRNSDIQVKQGSRELFTLPVFEGQAKGTATSVEDSWTAFSNLQYLGDDRPFTVDLIIAEGFTVPAFSSGSVDASYLEVAVKGLRTVVKNN